MIPFAEVQFPSEISYGSKGGPVFSTEIITSFSGHEQRCINWAYARSRYDIGSGIKTEEQWHQLIAFFRARRGRAIGFRYKDWSDYRAINQVIGIGDGKATQFQLIKTYKSDSDYYEELPGSSHIFYRREIKKPIKNNIFAIYFNSRKIETETETEGIYWIDFTTGIIEFASPPSQGASITADFEFDVPVRFDTDHLDLQSNSFGASSWNNIPLVEIKL